MWIEEELNKRLMQGTFRTLTEERPLIDLASNDYLGLGRSEDFSRRILEKWRPEIGSTGSRLLTGNRKYTEELESRIAAFHGFEAGLLFTSGYTANLGLLSAIAGPGDCILYDVRVHASTLDGIRLSKATSSPWRHNDLNHLEKKLKKGCFVCVEALYSIGGTLAPLKEIADLCNRYGAYLIVDEAHSVGVYGREGRGRVFEDKIPAFATVVGFGKALGCQGAIVLGSAQLRTALINFSRPFIYTTAPSLPSLLAIETAYELLPTLEKERNQLKLLGESPIRPLYMKGARACSRFLQERGMDVRAILPPTGRECLRLCLHSFNTIDEIITLYEWIDLWINSLSLEMEQASEKR